MLECQVLIPKANMKIQLENILKTRTKRITKNVSADQM